jgi:uncharacterized membrane protein
MAGTGRAVAAGLGVGAVAEYLLDPDRGRARRARLRDKTGRLVRRVRIELGVLTNDVGNRSRGVVAESRYRFSGNDVDPRVLHERVRAELGRHVRHPHAITVRVDDGGVITLTGDVLLAEQGRTLRGVRRVPGVAEVRPEWAVHEDPAGVPALQGAGRPREPVPELLQERWSPTARLLVASAAAGTWAGAHGMPGALRWPVRGASVVLAVRAASNLPVKRITGIGAGREAIEIEDAVTIAVPAERIWDWVSDYRVFQMIMPDVLEIDRAPDGRSHWVVRGPAGVPVRFDAEETNREDGHLLSWRTCDGQLVAHEGTLRLDQENGRTRVQVRLCYNPVAGAVGHAVAAMFRVDPKRKLREDLQRLKSFLETGNAPHDAAAP